MKSDAIIISIHPTFVEKILSGEKKYEFRKYFPEGVRYMLVYTTSPVKMITALIEIESVLKGSPNDVWRKTKKYAGVTKRFFDAYFKDKADAYAVEFKNIHVLEKPLKITEVNGACAAPQSYIYTKDCFSNIIDIMRKNEQSEKR